MAFDRRGERQVCTVCRKPFYDLNRPGAECPHCQPKPAPTKPTITIEPEEEPTMPGEPNPKADERREKIRSLLSERPMKMVEIIEATGGVPMTVRADLRWIGATQQGNRLGPWALPETPADAPVEKPARKKRAPVAETMPDDQPVFRVAVVNGHTLPAVAELPTQYLVECIAEGRSRIAALQGALKS